MDDLKAEGGAALAANPLATVALGLAAPTSPGEAALAAYHAPTRAALKKAGVDPARVLGVRDFTTRSADDATLRLTAMRAGVIAAVTKNEATVILDSVVLPPSNPIAAIVEGRLSGLPSYVDSAGLTLDAKGLAVAIGKRDAPFRVVVPVGTGDYRFVMYGHGTGGNFHDATLDTEIATFGVGKVGIQFDGWTDKDVLDTFVSLGRMFQGTEHSTSGLMQSLADGAGIEASVAGALGAALSAPMLGNQPNPAAGRHLDDSIPIWAGGSLGGTMGPVYASADPAMKRGVLNVPGGGWTHFIPGSVIVSMLGPLLQGSFGRPLDLSHALAMSQGNWDDVDGAVWAGDLAAKKQVFLIQESIGDPVLEKPGERAPRRDDRRCAGGQGPRAHRRREAGERGRRSKRDHAVPRDRHGSFDMHGIAARDTPAGIAARDQITTFV